LSYERLIILGIAPPTVAHANAAFWIASHSALAMRSAGRVAGRKCGDHDHATAASAPGRHFRVGSLNEPMSVIRIGQEIRVNSATTNDQLPQQNSRFQARARSSARGTQIFGDAR
jgi:hypothetical protein